jgi:hypothetical protein
MGWDGQGWVGGTTDGKVTETGHMRFVSNCEMMRCEVELFFIESSPVVLIDVSDEARSCIPGYALLPGILTADIFASMKSCFGVKLRIWISGFGILPDMEICFFMRDMDGCLCLCCGVESGHGSRRDTCDRDFKVQERKYVMVVEV